MAYGASQEKATTCYLDPFTKKRTVKILPGEYFVCNVQQEVIVTTLGSCIAACIWDKNLGLGGMNHFMLAESEIGAWGSHSTASTRFGNFAMEFLINEILKQGGQRQHLRAKIFGGARMNTGGEKVGQANIQFAHGYLRTEKIPILADDTGGNLARKVYFEPQTGGVKVKKLENLQNDTISARESAYEKALQQQNTAEDDILLF